jgi:prepilin-type N-terminal cleavage/methylation domain-containing protein
MKTTSQGASETRRWRHSESTPLCVSSELILSPSPCLPFSLPPCLRASAWNRLHPRGFTLLEVVIVLVIMSLLIGMAVVSVNSIDQEQDVRRPVSEFTRMTQEAVQRAGIYERPQVIQFDKKGFSMRYRTDADGRITTDDTKVWQRRVEIPDGMKFTLRRFGSTKFAPAAGQRLVIAPGGLCEPLTARFELNGSWIETSLDPLSGGPRDEAMFIQ